MIQEDKVESDRRKASIEWPLNTPADLNKPPRRWEEVRELLVAADSLVAQARLKVETIILTPDRDKQQDADYVDISKC